MGLFREISGQTLAVCFGVIVLGNLIPFLIFWVDDWFLSSVPIFVCSATIPYIFLPISLFRLIRKRDHDQIEAEQKNERVRNEARIAVRSAESQAGFRMAATVAHDIRSPLSTLNLVTSLLPTDEKTELLRRAVSRIEAISGSLLKSYRKSKSAGLQESYCHAKSILHNIQEHYQSLVPDLKIQIRTSPAEVILRASAIELERHLFNLMNNAVESMAAAGTSEPRILIEIQESEDQNSIRIKDNGPGIAPEFRERLFQDRATYGKSSGNGMALSAAKRYFESLGGTIVCEPSPAGASFLIRIPSAKKTSEVQIRGFLLLVDDDKEILSLLSSQIPSAAARFTTQNPHEALKEIERLNKSGETYTLISDLVFTGYDILGFDLIRAAGESKVAHRYLYTSLAEEEQIREMAAKTGVLVFDKADPLLLRFPN
jgi:signal transduction histidine kinase/CheY-like chemotaxis protein